jgi:hypothetical protein
VRLVTQQRTYLSISGFEAWTAAPATTTREISDFGFGNKENGFCVTSKGRDQNSGVKKLGNFNVNTPEMEQKCLEMCSKVPNATGCEGIWNQGNRGCYAHTAEIARGNGRRNHSCWVKKQEERPPVEFGSK